MTEPTIRSLARELAGAFYEQERTKAFRAAFPKVEHYLQGWQHLPDGRLKKVEPGWQHHVVLARQILVRMLGMPDAAVDPALKERIYQAILDDRGQAERIGKKVSQRMVKQEDFTNASKEKPCFQLG